MNLIAVNNIDDLKIYGSLRDNAVTADDSFIADSPKVVKMLLEQGWEVKSLLAQESFYRDNETFLANYHIPKAYVASKKDAGNKKLVVLKKARGDADSIKEILDFAKTKLKLKKAKHVLLASNPGIKTNQI